MKVSIIIPTFNGQNLLAKNLDKVIKIMRTGDELIIVDDASEDKTVAWLKKEYKLKQVKTVNQQLYRTKLKKGKQLTLLANKINQRFAKSVNLGVNLAKNQLVFLLNNDVIPEANILNKLTKHFTDKKVFAVGCLEIENKQKKIKGGKNKLWFEKGMFMHSRADKFTSGSTAWASGGSAIFDKDKWQQLGGFSLDYQPAYWEDIDLSFRAKEKGWKILFDQKAKVNHKHETTNKKVFKNKLRKISWKNANKFTWKHGDFWQKLAHLLWKPFWFYQQNKNKPIFLLAIIFLLAAFLRFYKLGQVPHGMTWDEAAIGYNGFAILTTRRDEWLHRLPISFQSFGDYKAPLAIYLNGFFTYLFGMNLWAVRLPFVLFSLLAIIGIYLLTLEIWTLFKLKKKNFSALLAAFLLTLSPWHLHFSRTGFESGIALSLIIWASYFLSKFLNNHQDKIWKKSLLLTISGFLLNLSLYAYHSSKIVAPLILFLFLLTFFKKFKKKFKIYFIPIIINLIIVAPLVFDTFWGKGFQRSETLIIFTDIAINKKISILFKNFITQLSPQFLVLGLTDSYRHGPGKWGVLLPLSFIILIYTLAKAFFKKNTDEKKSFKFFIFWILLGLIPAILGETSPHANRALLALPGFIFLITKGFSQIKNKSILRASFLIHFISFILFQKYYYQQFNQLSAEDFKDGYLKAFSLAKDYEKGINNKPQVDQILFTSDYGQPYIYALFIRKTNPIWYQGGSLIKYQFTDDINRGALMRQNTLVVASKEDDLPAEEADHLIYGSDGQIRFKVYYLP